jgi:deoxyribodipyrimidine photo-lyase
MTTAPTDLTALLTLPRAELVAAVAAAFPAAVYGEAAGCGAEVPRGGRAAAEPLLAAVDPRAYARSRNHVAGAVTGLSPWIRHGVVSPAEVRDLALARVERPEEAEKLVAELAWREYWRAVQLAIGAGIHADIEPPAAPARRPDRLDHVPEDVLAAATGMRCIDAFVTRLHATGRLHNHERMWLASWLVHVRGVHWRAGADWFLRHLLDGDPASNHLSWQWVAGTFAAKPYIFNRENLEAFTSGAHCRSCPLLGRCDVEGSYEDLAARLFAPGAPASRQPLRIVPAAAWRPAANGPIRRPLVWLGLDSAAPTSPAAAAHPGAPRLFVLDPAWLGAERPAAKRLVFLLECLADVDGLRVEVGDPRSVVPAVARRLGCDGVAVTATPCPRDRAAAESVAGVLPLEVHQWPSFCDHSRVADLGRFSRFWQKVRASAVRPTAS